MQQKSTFSLSKRLPEQHRSIATLLAFALIPVSGLATDIYLPSMPHMATGLGVRESNIQLTLSLFLVSYGCAQLIAGSFLDSFGRYRLCMAALFIFSISAIITAISGNIVVICAMRIVQGICTGMIVVSKRAFFVDVHKGEKQKHYLSIMTIVWSSAPIIAPFIGGYLEAHFNWRANFFVLAGYCTLLLVLEYIFSGETIEHYHPLQLRPILRNYGEMLRAADFVYGLIMLGLSYGITMIFGLSGPFIIEHQMGYSPVVAGYASLVMGLAWMCGGFLGKAMIRKEFLPKLRKACIIQIILIIAMITTTPLLNNIWSMILFAFSIHVTAGFIFNNYFAYSLSRFPRMAGMAGGLTGGMAYMITSVMSYGIASIIGANSQQTLGYSYLVMGVVGLGIMLVNRTQQPATTVTVK
ncbi:MAG TPA: Bcr/CflA family efflux MFS transporter [Chitinophaga sp.]|uniref:Bcr/CflA family efflux MFS transporter n=1 Tax=Chitinophaga sp. TaxID=1869181 RepID=UPI002BC009EF|nr:Bcr/CflA family efflux MFS transporter [Chitinophaga sp.]HVI49243.1 Bcr/CflA family efflux MFS transporter [Chitinophaga sp.]